ncbi:MAG: flagellar hook-basal body complex protein [Xanthobacteraceae bacterium]
MGIFDALTTAVAGLQAQSFALQNISGNIANSQTVGYKETNTSFQDLVSQATLGQQTANGVLASSSATNTVQGTIQSETVPTDMAINGDGWFVVAQPTGFVDNQPVFSSNNDYTRRGDFQLNQSGNLVNGAGYYLMGIPVDAATGNPLGSSAQVLQFNNNFVPAQETTAIQYQANLPSTPSVGSLNGGAFTSDPVAGAQIIGTGATLKPDAPALGTGTVGGLTNATLLSSLTPPIALGNTITVSDGVNTTTYTSNGADTIGNLITAINSGAPGNADVSASLSSSGNLVLTPSSASLSPDTETITVGGTATAAAAVGFGVANNTFQPTNLLTQGISAGNTLTVTVSGGAPQTITFGLAAGDVATMAQLQTKIQTLTGVSGNVNTANGDITLTGTNPAATIVISGTAGVPALFGIQNLTANPGNGTVIGTDVPTFDAESVDGGSITCYDAQGNPVNVDFRWAQVSTSPTGNLWQMFYQTNANATGSQAAWQNVGSTFMFNASGQLSSINGSTTNLTTVPIQNLTVNGDSLGNVQVNLGTSGLTQYASSNGNAQVNSVQQNGFAAGQLQSISVDTQNRVVGAFSNGQTIPLAEITLATFAGQDALQPLNGEAYAATAESGPANYSATGSIVGSSLEASNVDIATQFSQLIVAQQAYGANAKVMSTADQMIQSLLQVIQ